MFLSTYKNTLLSKGLPWYYKGSALDLDFANQRAYNSMLGFPKPDDILTYTAPSPKLVYGNDGVLGFAPHNLLTYSEDINQGQWTVTNITINSTTQFTFDTNAGYFRRTIESFAPAKYELIVKLSGSNPGDTFRLELVDGADGSDSAYSVVTVPASPTEFIVVADMSGATFSGNLMVAINRTTDDRSITAGSTVTITRMHLRRTPGDATYVPTTSAAVYRLPYDYHPTTHEALGVLIEEQRTNLLLRSQEFDNAAWTKAASTITANAAVAPDGTTTADKLVETATTAAHTVYRPETVTAVAHTLSFYLKAAERTWAYVRLAVVAGQGAYFDLANGVVGTVEAGVTARIQNVGNGWYRCSVTITTSATAWYSGVETAAADNVSGHAGDGTSGIYVWGAQLEAGAFATSYIPTVASQVTRAGDQISILTSAFGYSGSANGTVVWKGVLNQTSDSATKSLVVIDANGRMVWANGSNIKSYDGTTTLAYSVTITKDVAFTVAVSYGSSFQAMSINGAAVETAAFDGTMGAGSSLFIGYSVGSQMFGHIKRLTYFPTRKPDSELITLTI